jgi:hypothetical protein
MQSIYGSISVTFGVHASISEFCVDIDEFYIVLEHFVYYSAMWRVILADNKHNHVCPFAHFTFWTYFFIPA